MITLGLTPPAREDRSTNNYTSDRLNALFTTAAVGPVALATATASIETAIVWARALSLATVTPQTNRTRRTPGVLAADRSRAGSMGSIVFARSMRLRPAAYAQVVRGTNDPASWEYLLTRSGHVHHAPAPTR